MKESIAAPGTLTIHPIAKALPRMDDEAFEVLVSDVKKRGVLIPIVLYKGQILDGRHRYEACKQLGIDCPTMEWDKIEAWRDIQSLNLVRRHLAKDQEYAIRKRAAKKFPEAAEQLEAIKEEAHVREKAGKDLGPRGQKGKSSDIIGKKLNMSGRTVRRVDQVERLIPEELENIAKGKVTANEVLKSYKKAEKKKQIEEKRMAAASLTKPSGLYDVIAIDPPWRYRQNEFSPDYATGVGDYPTLSLAEIKAIKIPAKKDCVLWLWFTNQMVLEAFEVLAAWGFEYKNFLTWDKVIPGIGSKLLNQTEHCIMATKGKPLMNLTNQTTLIREKRREHSRKPENFYEQVETLCAGEMLDYFGRTKRKGWDVWGAEAERFQVNPQALATKEQTQ